MRHLLAPFPTLCTWSIFVLLVMLDDNDVITVDTGEIVIKNVEVAEGEFSD